MMDGHKGKLVIQTTFTKVTCYIYFTVKFCQILLHLTLILSGRNLSNSKEFSIEVSK